MSTLSSTVGTFDMNFKQCSDNHRMFPGTVNWYGFDDEARFRENVKKQPDVMTAWKGQTFNYTLNSQGFRAPEFLKVDWANSVVVLGCSIVFGEGLDNTQCLTHQLSEIIGRPVINLGIPGAGPDLIFYNSMVLQRKYPQTQQVIIVWPGADRLTEFTDQGANNYGIWNCDPTKFEELKSWHRIYATMNANPEHRAHVMRMYSCALQSIWGQRLREFTWAPETANHIGCKLLNWERKSWDDGDSNRSDRARDLLHPGRDWHRAWAKQIAKNLK
jgi:hypothetical protein